MFKFSDVSGKPTVYVFRVTELFQVVAKGLKRKEVT
jgi:hypothetical protein